MESVLVARCLAVLDEGGERRLISQSELAKLPPPLVILGDPGMGKSVLMEELGRVEGNRFVRAGTFARSKAPHTFAPQDGLLIIDGLDEVGAASPGDGVDAVLSQLSAIGSPPFVLSSREADWRGAADRIRLEDDYGRAATVLHMLPFEMADANAFLTASFPSVDAEEVLTQLAGTGLAEIYRNPLTLRMIGEVWVADGALPRTRSELLDRACRLMLIEDNPRHQAVHAGVPDEDIMLAAGAVCASLLLCDRVSVFNGPRKGRQADDLLMGELSELPYHGHVAAALATRLFQADGEHRLVPAHRVIAEHLGGRWVAAVHRAGASERRLRSLMTIGGGVPTSLRGLNAWTAHFSEELAPGCIAADPYAVLRYGDADRLSLNLATLLLNALAKLSAEDPYFRAQDWSSHPAVSLIRLELRERVLEILTSSGQNAHLSMMLLEAMPGSELATVLAPELLAKVMDVDQLRRIRSLAAEALVSSGQLSDVRSVIETLLSKGDYDSAEIAYEIVADTRGQGVSGNLVANVLLAYAGISVCHLSRARRGRNRRTCHIDHSLFVNWDSQALATLLDALAERTPPLVRKAAHWDKETIADFVRGVLIVLLDRDDEPSPERLWLWIGWLREGEGHDQTAMAEVTAQLRRRTELRRGVQAVVLVQDDVVGMQQGEQRLYRNCAGLSPDAADVVTLLNRLQSRWGTLPPADLLLETVSLAPRRKGIDPIVLEAARHLAGGRRAVLAKLDEWSRPLVEKDGGRKLAAAEKERKKRRNTYARVRQQHSETRGAIDGGEGWALDQAAEIYLGRYAEFDKVDSPEVRLEKLLGAELAEAVMLGFMTTLRRDDLPTPAQIASDDIRRREWKVARPLICGVAEMLRRGLPLTDVAHGALASAYMAWRRAGESNVAGGVEVGEQVEEILFSHPDEPERFFRTSIEPQLEEGCAHVWDLYKLRSTVDFRTLSAELALDWLVRFGQLPPQIEVELLDQAIRYGKSEDLRAFLSSTSTRVHVNHETMLSWLVADFLVRFDETHDHLLAAATDDPSFLWHLRAGVGDDHRRQSVPLSIKQRMLIVEAFRLSWTLVNRPEGITSGDLNPWDASAFVDRMIYAIAGDADPAATVALRRLLNTRCSYRDSIRHALVLQLRLRRDHEFRAASPSDVVQITSGGLPEGIDDMRAFLGDRIDRLRKKMHGTNTDMWEAYWSNAKPRGETFCRNRLIEHISRELPEAIRFEPEMYMPDQKRADIAAICGHLGLPVEIKGQWHREVWNAPIDQLAARYARDWHAEGRGAYIVLWFGEVKGGGLPRPPEGVPRPTTPEELEVALKEQLPVEWRDLIDIYVVDVSRPPERALADAASDGG